MSVGRRDFVIGALGAATGAKALLGCGDDGNDSDNGGNGATPDKLALNATLFAHGVASGDPTPDGVILWTRVSTGAADPLEVEWAISSDAGLSTIVQRGTQTASANSDFTVKVDVIGLTAGTTYYYVFFAGDRGRSTIGRTRTLPATLDHARLVFTSCANYQNGFFNAYRAIAQRNDLDVWIHLGDYIYEYKAGEYADPNLMGMRAHVPAQEAVLLADYRIRYASYRTDTDLQEIHRQHPLIVVWDDHEFANNAWSSGAENHMPDSEGDWTARQRAASQAFFEWLPIRIPAGSSDPVPKIFRTFKFGDLFDLLMLDTRIIARDKQAGDDSSSGTGVGDPAVWHDPNRHIIGTEQETWLLNELTQSQTRGARWRLIGNQVIFSQVRDPRAPVASDAMMSRNILYSDFWDGYQTERDDVIDKLVTNGIHNVVFLTGDIHSSWAFEISKDPFNPAVYDPANGRSALAIELVGPSITSQALEDDPSTAALAPVLLRGALASGENANPHLKYVEVTRKGYVLVDLTQERLQAEWWFVRQYKTARDASEELAKAFTCQQSSASLVETSAASAAKEASAAAPA